MALTPQSASYVRFRPYTPVHFSTGTRCLGDSTDARGSLSPQLCEKFVSFWLIGDQLGHLDRGFHLSDVAERNGALLRDFISQTAVFDARNSHEHGRPGALIGSFATGRRQSRISSPGIADLQRAQDIRHHVRRAGFFGLLASAGQQEQQENGSEFQEGVHRDSLEGYHGVLLARSLQIEGPPILMSSLF